jgi:hypothetical protein
MSDPFEGGPPLLTEVIESGLREIEQSTAGSGVVPSNPQLDILLAQLPELFERALLRVKPQLLQEFANIIRETLHNKS